MAEKKLYRSRKDKKVFGVCGGLAQYFDFDVSIVRIAVVMLMLASLSLVFWVYIIAGFIVPEAPDDAE